MTLGVSRQLAGVGRSGCCVVAGPWQEVDSSWIIRLQESSSSFRCDWRSRAAPQSASVELGYVPHEAQSLIGDVVVLFFW